MKMVKVVGLIFGLVGLILLTSSVFVFSSTRSFINRSVTTTGAVVDVAMERDDEYDLVYYPVVTFETETGQQVTFKSNVGSNHQGSIGEIVPVRYDPARPHDAEINNFFSLWLAFIILLILGLVFTGVGSGLWFYFSRHPELAELEAMEGSPHRLSIRFGRN